MRLHARPAKWFELVTTRQHLAVAMQTLAASGAVELEAQPVEGTEPVLPHLQEFFDTFHSLERTYGPYWPVERGEVGVVLDNPIAELEGTLATLAAWIKTAGPLIEVIQASAARQRELDLVGRLIASLAAGPRLAGLLGEGPRQVGRAIYFLPTETARDRTFPDVLTEWFPDEDGSFVIAVGNDATLARFRRDMAALKASEVPLPGFLGADARRNAEEIQRRIEEAENAGNRARSDLDQLSRSHGLAEALSRVTLFEWLYRNSNELQATRLTVRITGWTSEHDDAALREALHAAGVTCVLHVVGNGGHPDAPLVLDNPDWLRPFEFFTRLLGVPGHNRIDPSAITAAVAPLLFGFMFGDVGQGAVLVGVGLLLSDRMPLLRLLVPGGISAMAFGVLFGSVFSLENVIPALWVHPLDAPTTLLGTSLGIGAVILAGGIALDLLQANWRRGIPLWVRAHGGLVIAYFSLLAAVFWPPALWGLPIGLAFAVLGAQDERAHWTVQAAGANLAEFVEGLMRLFVSTVSFARVGAFALAHAGLSTAIVGVGEAAGGIGFWVVLLIGNALIIALEGLVTGIQTTRLILFEFFVRFFSADGREFRPLSAPGPTRPPNLEGGKTT